MPTYVAFLRAVNLGPVRKFPKAELIAATEAAGGTAVATHATSGNVRLTSPLRSTAAVAAALQRAYAADRGFEVPTVVFSRAELVELTRHGQHLRDQHRPGARNYVTLFAEPPTPPAIEELAELNVPGERCVVHGRAAYVLIDGDVSTSRLLASKQFAGLGMGTARTITMLATLVAKWCPDD